LTTLLTVAIAVLTVALTWVGIEMVNKPPTDDRQRWMYRGIVLVCGALLIAATAILSVHTERANRDAEEKSSQNHLQDVGQMQYMKGKLDAISDVLSRFAANIQASVNGVGAPQERHQVTTTSALSPNTMSPANIATTLADVAKDARNNPSVENVRFLQRGFSDFAKSVGPSDPCLVKITAPEDSRMMASDFAQLALIAFSSIGSKCKVEGPGNLDVDPDTRALAIPGMVSGKVIFHADRNQKGAEKLFNELSFNTPMQKSFEIPSNVPSNYVWLQFGPGMRWKN
jgi:hypothetical protein